MSKIVIVILVVAAILAIVWFERKRTGNLSAVAERLGLEFHPGMQTLPEAVDRGGFDLFTQGPPNINNLFSGERDGRPLMLFEFTYQATSSGEGSRDVPLADDQTGLERRTQTVLWRAPARPLPVFDLSPADGHQRTVAARFGLQPVMLPNHPEFTLRYRLLAQRPEVVAGLFDDRLVELLLSLSGPVIEARPDGLLLYRFEQRLAAGRLPELLALSDRLLERLQ